MTGQGTRGEVRDGSGDSRRCPGQVGGPSLRSGTGWGTLGEVRDRLRHPFGEVRDGSRDPRAVRDGSGDPRGSQGRIEKV